MWCLDYKAPVRLAARFPHALGTCDLDVGALMIMQCICALQWAINCRDHMLCFSPRVGPGVHSSV